LGAGEVVRPLDEWTDAKTGRRVVRLTRREGHNRTFYFHQNNFTESGDKMIFIGSAPDGNRAFAVDVNTLATETLTDRSVGFEVVDAKRRKLYYLSGDAAFSTCIDTKETREIAKLPPHYKFGRGLSVSADGKTLLGCYALGEEKISAGSKDEFIAKVFAANLPNALYTIDIETGKMTEILRENTWFGHTQFSPTDPQLIEFCHEGPEDKLDRMWLIRADGSGLRNLRPRSVPGEWVSHEFWAPDGKSVWFDLLIRGRDARPSQKVASLLALEEMYVAKVDIATGTTTRYGIPNWSHCWHYNVSADGLRICGDGDHFWGNSSRWIFLYDPDGAKMKITKLCSLAENSYREAPNARFTPDGKRVVFQADMGGSMNVYAVEAE